MTESELTDSAMIAVINTTLTDHERRLSAAEANQIKDRQMSDEKFASLQARFDESVQRLNDKIDNKVAEMFRWFDEKHSGILNTIKDVQQTQDGKAQWLLGFTITAIIIGLSTLAAVVGSWATRGALH